MTTATTANSTCGRREFPPAAGESFDPSGFRYDSRGLVPVVVQDISSGTVLMVAWANHEALNLTAASGRAHFYSRSRQAMWQKGETSGNELLVLEMWSDCDRDTLLYRVQPSGPTCHTGERSCFDSPGATLPTSLELGWLARIIEERARAFRLDPSTAHGSYTASLLEAGRARVAQKVGEEATEVVIAALSKGSGGSQSPEASSTQTDEETELVGEAADLLFHLLVLLESCDVEPQAVAAELRRRHDAAPRAMADSGGGDD